MVAAKWAHSLALSLLVYRIATHQAHTLKKYYSFTKARTNLESSVVDPDPEPLGSEFIFSGSQFGSKIATRIRILATTLLESIKKTLKGPELAC